MSDDLHTSPDSSSIEDLVPSSGVPRLFRHKRREEWGLGIVVDAQDDRVDLQFQDGQSRSFKRDFLHLLDPVERRLDVTMGIVEALQNMSDRSPKTRVEGPRPISTDEQIVFFKTLFAEGFKGAAFEKEHRGDERKRALKRHRAPLVTAAAEMFASRDQMEAMAAENPSAVFDAAAKLVASTDFVSAAERKRVLAMAAEHHAAFASALIALLFDETDMTTRFDAFVVCLEQGLGSVPSWPLVSLFAGARFPTEHVVVHESTFAQQALFMAPGLSVPQRPMGIIYERLLSMTQSVRDLLEKEKLEPRDLLDVQEFMQLTLKSKAQQHIRDLRKAKKAADDKGAREVNSALDAA